MSVYNVDILSTNCTETEPRDHMTSSVNDDFTQQILIKLNERIDLYQAASSSIFILQ